MLSDFEFFVFYKAWDTSLTLKNSTIYKQLFSNGFGWFDRMYLLGKYPSLKATTNLIKLFQNFTININKISIV